MATGEPSPSENITADDFRHCCSLCMEPYRGRCPKLLPCFHTFCLPCLTALADNAARSGTGEGDGEKDLKSDDKEKDAESGGEEKGTEDKTEDDHHGDTFLCPTCRAPVVIQGGVTTLQTNFYIEHELSRASQLCEVCEEGEEKEGNHFCRECEQRLCGTCKRLHGRVKKTRGHQVEEVKVKPVFQHSQPVTSKKKWCLYHPDQMVCIHCCECDVSMCTVCGVTDHKSHKTVDMFTAARQAKQQLTTVVIKADEQLVMINACLSRLERDTQDLHHQKQEISQQINARHELLTFWADRARDEVLESLTAKAEVSLCNITTAKNIACAAKAIISRLRGRAWVKDLLGCEELVQLKSDLQAALLKDQLLTRFTPLADHKEQTTFFTCTADPSALDLDLLRLFIGDMVEGEKSVSTVKEMSAKMAELESALVDLQERKIPSLETKLSEKNAALEAALDDLKTVKVAALEADMKDIKDTKITALETTVKGLADKSVVPKVSFHALDTGKSYNRCSKIIFNQVDSNNGNGYNPSDGVFTAPEAGTYMFMATVRCNENGSAIQAYLAVKGDVLAFMQAPESATVHATVSLNKGDQVYVATNNSFNSYGHCTYFSGAIISF